MVIDPSALVAILRDEVEAPELEERLAAADVRFLSAASLVEASIVLEARFGPRGLEALDQLLHVAGVEIVAVDRDQAEVARGAWRRFGRGRHPAGLNFGDCFAYALARVLDEPLLFVGDDFGRTDLRSARPVPDPESGSVHEPEPPYRP